MLLGTILLLVKASMKSIQAIVTINYGDGRLFAAALCTTVELR